MARKLAAVAFSLGCLHASSLMALGLGELKMESFLNQPLKASVDLLNMGTLHEDEIRVRLATTEDFEKLGLDRAYFLTSITFEVVSSEGGGAKILMSSDEPVLEPYLDFVVEARWPSGRLLREYTVLVDPPAFSQATPVVSASERVEATEGIAAPAKKSDEFASGQASESSFDYDQAVRTRAYDASSQGSPAPGSRYTIRPNQTLWEIASMARPQGTSVHQTMLDIQRLNPDAFINGNINRIKAGYIIYLPSSDDISSADLPSALAEVREQNQAWREGRDEAPYTDNRPSLRISAEPEESVAVDDSAQGSGAADVPSVATTEAGQAGDSAVDSGAGSVTSETLDRLAELEERLQTLQRIISLKDDQIAALQDALKQAGVAAAGIEPGLTSGEDAADMGLEPPDSMVDPDAVDVDVDVVQIEEPPVQAQGEADVAVAPVNEAAPEEAVPAPAVKPPAEAPEQSWASYLLYILGALVLAIAGFVFARRRAADAEDDSESIEESTPQEDVFADVRLQDHKLEVVPAAEKPERAVVEHRRPPASMSAGDNRGYGERKHDEYASDVDAADALAEADIYVAYGRHPQAIDLLNNALAAEPSNPVYRLKLLEIYVELKDRVAATAQMKHITATGDTDSIARANSLIEAFGEGEQTRETPTEDLQSPRNRGPGVAPNPLEILNESNDSLEEDFSGLEIEEPDSGSDEDDLDLSADFTIAGAGPDEDEDLVIAADSNALSTKLDLARAYLDMGDDDGARQILDEVVAEGTEDLRAEARTLLARIG